MDKNKFDIENSGDIKSLNEIDPKLRFDAFTAGIQEGPAGGSSPETAGIREGPARNRSPVTMAARPEHPATAGGHNI